VVGASGREEQRAAARKEEREMGGSGGRIRKGRVLIAAFVLVLTCAAIPAGIDAGWVDDWIDQKSVSSPDYQAGKDRGYISMGGFSARWRTSNDYLVTVQKPRLKGGCGGIDMFLGGLSFLNFDYLVKKLQRILQTAPAVAFDLALKALCPECSETMKAANSWVDMLNSLQIDDCKAAQALVYASASPFAESAAFSADAKRATDNFMTSSGFSEFWNKADELIKSKKGDQDDAEIEEAASPAKQMEGCPEDIKNLFKDGSVLVAVGKKAGIANEDYIDLFRGLFGDAEVYENLDIDLAAPCGENSDLGLDDFIHGEFYVRPYDSKCEKNSESKANLYDYMSTNIRKIIEQMAARGELDEEKESFLKSMPISIYPIIKVAVQTGQQGTLVPTIADLAAKAYVFRMMDDLLTMARKTSDTSRRIIENPGVKSGYEAHQCQTVHLEKIAKFLLGFEHDVKDRMRLFTTSYNSSLAEMGTLLQASGSIQTFQTMAIKDLSGRSMPFGAILRGIGR